MTGVVVNVFRVLAACTSLMMILSPIPTVFRIVRTKETGHMSMFPLIAVLANCHTWMMYGYLGDNIFPVFTTFVIGDCVSVFYVAIFYYYSSERPKANKLLFFYGIFMIAATVFAFLAGYGYTGQTDHQVTQTSGYFAVAASLVLYLSPLEKLVLVFRYKSGVFLPIHMVIAGLTNNTTWVIYTSLTANWLMFTPNLITLIVGVFQLIVYYFIYNPKTHPLSDDWKNSIVAEDSTGTPLPSDDEFVDLESPGFVGIKSPKTPPPPAPRALEIHVQV